MPGVSRRLAAAGIALAALIALGGCQPPAPAVITAELLEPGEPGNPHPDDAAIRLRLASPCLAERLAPEGWKALASRIRIAPVADCFFQIRPPSPEEADRPIREIYLKIRGDARGLEPRGLHAPGATSPGEPTGIGIDLGSGVRWIDLQRPRRHPRLERASWLDANGNWIVDHEDRVSLHFDRPVLLMEGADGAPGDVVRVPEDIYVTAQDDRLADDEPGSRPARFLEPQDQEASISIVLGEGPRLFPIPAHRLGALSPGESIPGTDLRPSGIAIHGTSLQPMERIVDRESGRGSISDGATLLELPATHPFPRPLADAFPEPGPRSFLTATRLGDEEVALVGGLARDGSALDQILLYSSQLAEGHRLRIPAGAGSGLRLGEARYLHTATVLTGADGELHTADDLVVIAGGFDGQRALSSLEVVRRDPVTGDLRVDRPEFNLQVPRYDHTATRIRGNEILFLGGTRPGGPIIDRAEVISLEVRPGGEVEAWSRASFPLRSRTRHSATALGPLGSADAAVLVFGGLGDPLPRSPGSAESRPISPESAVILGSPVILRLYPDAPPDEIAVRHEFSYARLRFDHAATRLAVADSDGAVRVFIGGGSLRPLYRDLRVGRDRSKWEPPRGEGSLQAEFLREPDESDAAHSLLFTLEREDPGSSRLDLLPSPTGQLRVAHALLPLEGLGVLSLGGESPLRDEDREMLASGELYLPGRRQPSPFTVLLDTPRCRFAAVALGSPSHWRLLLFGGEGTEARPPADVVEIDLR